MKSLKYKDAVYVEAAGNTPTTKHKKCARGTHWNTKSKKCVKLPPGLKSSLSKANRATKAARTTSSADLHAKAAKAHSASKSLAKKHGFSGLVKYYDHFLSKHRGSQRF